MTDTTVGNVRWWETDGITFLNGVFEGGGAKGVAYGGALHAVCKADWCFENCYLRPSSRATSRTDEATKSSSILGVYQYPESNYSSQPLTPRGYDR